MHKTFYTTLAQEFSEEKILKHLDNYRNEN